MPMTMTKTQVAYGIGGLALLFILLQYSPRWGGWLLLLLVLGLVLFNREARTLITSETRS